MMVEPGWFFSTLAQSSAAIAGLIIAFSAVQDQLERQQRLKRTDELREELINFRDKYHDVVARMTNDVAPRITQREKFNETTKDCLSNPLDKDSSELKEVLQQDEDVERTQSTLIYVHLLRIINLIRDIEASDKPSSHYLLSPEQFDKLDESTKFLKDYFIQTNDGIEKLFYELGGETQSEGVSIYFTDVFGKRIMEEITIEKVAEWIQTYQPDQIESLVEMNKEPEERGRSLGSWGAVLGELRRDFETAYAKTGYTSVDYDPSSISNVFTVIGLLILVGVFIPLLFLFTPPQILREVIISGWLLYLTQIILLIVSGGVTLYLLHIIRTNIGDTP